VTRGERRRRKFAVDDRVHGKRGDVVKDELVQDIER